MEAQHSVNILAWELSLDFGLVPVDGIIPIDTPLPSKWVTLEVSFSSSLLFYLFIYLI